MKTLFVIIMGLLVIGCGTNYHTITLNNESVNYCHARLQIANEVLEAYNGETDNEIIEEDTYATTIFCEVIDVAAEDTLIFIFDDTVNIDGDITCIVNTQSANWIVWE